MWIVILSAIFLHLRHAMAPPTGEIVCSKCHSQLRLIALIKTESVAQKILKAMHLPTEIPELHPARPPRPPPGDTSGADDWLN
jgi:hypothetical protein